jgi:hypothetical protein
MLPQLFAVAAVGATLVFAHEPAAPKSLSSHFVVRAPAITPAPGAMPLAQITPQPDTKLWPPTSALPTATPGARPSGIPKAPALPDLTNWDGVTNWPVWDKPLDTKHPQVVQWVQQVRDSGIFIPDIKPHVVNGDNDCLKQENIPRINNNTECWWTCGKCTRKTDVIDCHDAKTWGSSFDDGPSDYTNELLIYLQQQKIKSTFFVVGGRALQRPKTLQLRASGRNSYYRAWAEIDCRVSSGTSDCRACLESSCPH